MLGRQILVQCHNASLVSIDILAHLFAHINKTSFSFLPIVFLLHLNPLLRLVREHVESNGLFSNSAGRDMVLIEL
jgi:hypothetical protein